MTKTTEALQEAALHYFIGSAGQQRVPADFLEGLVIPLPDIQTQKAIVSGVLSKRAAVEKEHASTDQHRDAMLKEIERNILTGTLS